MNKYTEADIIKYANEASRQMNTFYQSAFVNYKGTSSSNVLYSEIVAEWVLANIEQLSNDHIPMITRRRSYRTEGHDGTTVNAMSNRVEERIALEIKQQGVLTPIGTIIDYQTPLKNTQEDEAGKIDLLAHDSISKTLRLLELKKPDSNETLLRCVLEGYTYYRTANIAKLIQDFNVPNTDKVLVCPLFFESSNQYKEYQEMLEGKRPFLQQLMKQLEIELVLINATDATFYGQKIYSAKILKY